MLNAASCTRQKARECTHFNGQFQHANNVHWLTYPGPRYPEVVLGERGTEQGCLVHIVRMLKLAVEVCALTRPLQHAAKPGDRCCRL